MRSLVITTTKNGTIDPRESDRRRIKRAYASYGFERIFCPYKGHNERPRNVTGIPEGRIEGAKSINTAAILNLGVRNRMRK